MFVSVSAKERNCVRYVKRKKHEMIQFQMNMFLHINRPFKLLNENMNKIYMGNMA